MWAGTVEIIVRMVRMYMQMDYGLRLELVDCQLGWLAGGWLAGCVVGWSSCSLFD